MDRWNSGAAINGIQQSTSFARGLQAVDVLRMHHCDFEPKGSNGLGHPVNGKNVVGRALSQSGSLLEQPSVSRVPAHAAQPVSAGEFPSLKYEVDLPCSGGGDFHLARIPGMHPAFPECLLVEDARSQRIGSEALPFDRQPSFPQPERGLFCQGPGAKDLVLNHTEVKVNSAGFVTVHHKLGDHDQFPRGLPQPAKCDSIFA